MGPIPGAGSAASGQTPTRLLAVMAADVVDYTRLTEAAELETHVRLRALRVGIIDPCVVSYRGQIIKNTGDGFLATFDSSVDALRCAVEIQREIPLRQRLRPGRQARKRLPRAGRQSGCSREILARAGRSAQARAGQADLFVRRFRHAGLECGTALYFHRHHLFSSRTDKE